MVFLTLTFLAYNLVSTSPLQNLFVVGEPKEIVLSIKPEIIVKQLATENYCSCVKFVRSLGVEVPHIDAKWFGTFPHMIPKLNGLVIFKYGDSTDQYHIAYIDELGEDSFHIKEANYIPCKFSERWIPYDSDKILSFWNP